MADEKANPVGWFSYLLSDPLPVGIVTWVSLAVAIVGFGFALWQLSETKRAAEAARDATRRTVKLVGSHERSAKLTTTLEHLNSADDQIQRNNMDAAGAYLQVAWTALIEARELSELGADREQIISHIFAVRRMIDNIRAPNAPIVAQVANIMHAEIGVVIGSLGAMAAKVRFGLSGLEGQ